MRNIMFALIAAGTVAASLVTPAQASGGCGPYGHRTYYGACAPGGQWGFGPRAYFAGPGFGWGWHRPFYHRWHHWY